jgi:hypothetical protein
MPHFLITRPILAIRSAGQRAAPHSPDEPRRARRARRAGNRKIILGFVLLIACIALEGNVPDLLQVIADSSAMLFLLLGVHQVGWSRGFTSRNTTSSIVTVDLDTLTKTDRSRR